MKSNEEALRDWHRLFGLIMTDFFTGTPVDVETEVDLSLKMQLLDLVLLRLRPGTLALPLPDGLDNIDKYNLISFKSYQETLKLWTLIELLGHYVNYRKKVSPSLKQLLPGRAFHLYAVCARFPRRLFEQVQFQKLQAGVYRRRVLGKEIRVIVLHKLPKTPHNAMWHLFSALPAQVAYGAEHYQQRCEDTSRLLRQLFNRYTTEGVNMAFTMEQFRKQFDAEFLQMVPVAERLESIPVEERLKGLPVEERLKGLPVEERLKGLPVEERLKGLSPEEILKCLPPEVIDLLRRSQEGTALPAEKEPS